MKKNIHPVERVVRILGGLAALDSNLSATVQVIGTKKV